MDKRADYFAERIFGPVPASKVVPGDLYANGATVTFSGPSTPDRWSNGRSSWTIECGDSFAHGSDPDALIIVGRLSPFPPSTSEENAS